MMTILWNVLEVGYGSIYVILAWRWAAGERLGKNGSSLGDFLGFEIGMASGQKMNNRECKRGMFVETGNIRTSMGIGEYAAG